MAVLEVDEQMHFTGDIDLDNKIIATSSATLISNWTVKQYYKNFLHALDKYPDKVESTRISITGGSIASKLINLKYNYYENSETREENAG